MATSNPASWFNPSSDRVEAGGVGVVLSRLSTAQRTALTLAAGDAGLFTYDTQLNQLFAWNGTFSAQMAALNSAGGLSVVAPIVVATGIITTNNPGFQLTEQWNSGGVTFTAWFTNITDTSSAAASLFADFQLNSTSKFSIGKLGTLIAGQYATTGFYGLKWDATTGVFTITRSVDGVVMFTMDPGGSAFNTSGAVTVASTAPIKTASSTYILQTTNTLADASGAAAGTLTNAPTVGNPSKWIQINDNGTIRKIPTWL